MKKEWSTESFSALKCLLLVSAYETYMLWAYFDMRSSRDMLNLIAYFGSLKNACTHVSGKNYPHLQYGKEYIHLSAAGIPWYGWLGLSHIKQNKPSSFFSYLYNFSQMLQLTAPKIKNIKNIWFESKDLRKKKVLITEGTGFNKLLTCKASPKINILITISFETLVTVVGGREWLEKA